MIRFSLPFDTGLENPILKFNFEKSLIEFDLSDFVKLNFRRRQK